MRNQCQARGPVPTSAPPGLGSRPPHSGMGPRSWPLGGGLRLEARYVQQLVLLQSANVEELLGVVAEHGPSLDAVNCATILKRWVL
jgi:hypothetical protein